jgi:hypothetical protein
MQSENINPTEKKEKKRKKKKKRKEPANLPTTRNLYPLPLPTTTAKIRRKRKRGPFARPKEYYSFASLRRQGCFASLRIPSLRFASLRD